MKVKTDDLTRIQINYLVGKCEGYEDKDFCPHDKHYRDEDNKWYSPADDWAHGGPIIEREGIALYLYGAGEWNAHTGGREFNGPTPLIAAMRCFVVSKLGDECDIPDELITGE